MGPQAARSHRTQRTQRTPQHAFGTDGYSPWDGERSGRAGAEDGSRH